MAWRTYQKATATTRVMLMNESKNRTAITLMHASSNLIYISHDSEISTTNGLKIPANTPVYFSEELGHDVKSEMYVIANSGTDVITVREDYQD